MHNGIQPASSVEGRKSDDDYFWGLDAFPRPFLFLKCDELDLLCFETLSNCKTEKRDGHSSQNQLKSSRRDYGMYVVCPPPPQRVQSDLGTWDSGRVIILRLKRGLAIQVISSFRKNVHHLDFPKQQVILCSPFTKNMRNFNCLGTQLFLRVVFLLCLTCCNFQLFLCVNKRARES